MANIQQQRVGVMCNPQELKRFADNVLAMTKDKFRTCKRSQYTVWVWKAPAGYLFANKFEQPESYMAIMKAFKKPIVRESDIRNNAQAMAFLKQNGCYVTDGKRFVICGTRGEMWTVKPEKMNEYSLEDGSVIKPSDLSENKWLTIQRRVTEPTEVGLFVPSRLFVQLKTDWGTAYLNHPMSKGHAAGDVLVFRAGADGEPDYTQGVSPINNAVFESTFNQVVGGWSNKGVIKADEGEKPTLTELNSLLGNATAHSKNASRETNLPKCMLLSCKIPNEGIVVVFGKIDHTLCESAFGKTWGALELNDVKLKLKVKDGEYVNWTPKSAEFYGKTPKEIAYLLILKSITNCSPGYAFMQHNDLITLTKTYTEHGNEAFKRSIKVGNGIQHIVIPRIMYFDEPYVGYGGLYNLLVATDKYSFYARIDDPDNVLMLDAKFKLVTSNSGFVMDGLYEAASDVSEGTDQLRYGSFPDGMLDE